jgi:HD superfamily phosphodiesterase
MYDSEIGSVRKIWEEDILRFCLKLFEGHWLPSHDVEHHKRVWKNACILASNFNIKHEFTASQFFEQLLIACYFHDTGLLFEKGPKHGKESRRICEQFLHLHQDKIQFDKRDLLMAIEHHDDKDYLVNENSDQSVLYKVLSLADDLDAFGSIGCYRYIEIYLIRNHNPAEIPRMIIENAENRFRNFDLKLGSNKSIMQFIQEKFDILNTLVKEDAFSESPQSLVEWINSKVVMLQINPYTFFSIINIDEIPNGRIKFFLKQLRRELP